MAERADEAGVGVRIRGLRQRKGLSLRELAEASGMSSNAISLIERGENSPTVASLRRLAKGLGVPIAAFFQDFSERSVSFVKGSQRARSDAGGVLVESLSPGIVNQSLEPFVITLEVGAGYDSETYTHEGEEFVYCLHGSIEYQVHDRLYTMEAGDSLLFKASLAHRFRNLGASPAEALIVIEENLVEGSLTTFPAHPALHETRGRE